MKTLFEIQSDQPEFQAERKGGMGSSDAGAVYNIGFGCAKKLWYEKTGITPDFQKEETPELERGIFMESVCRLLYERKTGRKVETVPVMRHPDNQWMIAHLDGLTEAPEHAGKGYTEFKVVNRFVFNKFKKEGIRDEYILQGNHGMAVAGLSWASFGILCVEPWQFAWFDIDRDDALIEKLIQDEYALWKKVFLKQIPDALPLVKGKLDKRCLKCPFRRTCRQSDLENLIPESETEQGEIVSKPDLLPLLQEIDELGEMVDDSKALYDEARDKLKAEYGKDTYAITAPGFKAIYSKSWPTRVDSAALKSLEDRAKTYFSQYKEAWDIDSLEAYFAQLLDIVQGLMKIRKETPKDKPERTLRIYSTGD